MSGHIENIKNAVVNRNRNEIQGLIKQALETGEPIEAIMNDGLIAAMDVVGKLFSSGEIFVPEMLVSAMTMKLGLDVIKPLMTGEANAPKGTILMGTVKGDLHDIGKNIVIMMLEGAGFKVVDLGVDLSVDKMLEKVEELKPDILGLSALLTTTMPEMKNVISELTNRGWREKVKVMVGGAPVDAAFAQKIGADGYGKDAAEAVETARKLMS